MMLDSLPGGRASLPCHGQSYEWRRRKLAPAWLFRCKYRPYFTPFVQICENGEKNDVFLHHFPKLTTCRLLGGAVRRRVNQKSPLSIDSGLPPC